MTKKERTFLALILLSVALMVASDVINDSREGVVRWHIFIELLTGIAALVGVFYLFRGSVRLKHQLDRRRRMRSAHWPHT